MMQHKYQPPAIEFLDLVSDRTTLTVRYRITERGCSPVAGAALFRASADPAVEGKLLAVNLQGEGEGQFTLSRPADEAPTPLAVLAFDDCAFRVTSPPAFEPTIGDLPAGMAQLVQVEAQAALINFLTPDRLAVAEAELVTTLRATDA